ncbi:phosphoribosyltransferase family protein [Nocardia brasiliensis]|uniref:phosphoribosyltransferase family protein n=1 Tax=Nocardia brasiliensis TaxID=37326 RepID=UPI0024586C64|nr:phosphoribosyltransferase family protein [Nocardia brasiliensis]
MTTVPGSATLCRIAENAEVVVVDDVLTTGATVRESVRALARIGVRTRAVLVTCAA